MALNLVQLPTAYFPNPFKARPVFNGEIYIGEVGTDPEIPANQKQVFISDTGIDDSPIATSQPVSTGPAGVPTFNGSPVTVFVDGSYSIKVLDNRGEQAYYISDATAGIPITSDSLGAFTDYTFNNIADMADLITSGGETLTSVSSNQVAYVSQTGRNGHFVYFEGDFATEVSGDPQQGIYVPLSSDPAGSLGCWVRVVSNSMTPEMWGAVGDGVTDDTDAITAALSSEIKIIGNDGSVYRLDSAVIINDKSIDFDMSNSSIISYEDTGIRLQFYYPYGEPLSISTVDLANRQYTVSDASGLFKGQRIKIASNDRSQYNRPAPGDGRDYWQAQTFTILEISGNVVTVEQFAEEDYTFATTPIMLPYNKKSCNIYNGTIQANEGAPDTDVNGLMRIFGGVDHKLTNVTCELSAWTAFGFSGCDNPVVNSITVRNVGRDTDVQGNHGVDFISCNRPVFTNSIGGNCRHTVTNNSTPTQWADQNYYLLGDSFDMQVSGSTADSDRNNPFDTHHGIRRAQFIDNIATNSETGFAARGQGIRFVNNFVERCGRGFHIWTEAGVASADKTNDCYIGGSRVKRMDDSLAQNASGPIVPADIRVNGVGVTTLGENYLTGELPYSIYASDSTSVRVNGVQYCVSNAEFEADRSLLWFIDTEVLINANINITASDMTINGSNNIIEISGSGDFICNSVINALTPTSGTLNRVILNSRGALDVFDIDLLKFNGAYSNPIGFGSTIAQVIWENQEQKTSSAYLEFTLSANYDLEFRFSKDCIVYVNLALAGLSTTLNSIADGVKNGQRVVLFTEGAGDFTIPNAISNILNRTGADIVMTPNDVLSFFWDGTQWVNENTSNT